jgi:membrane-bound serine protease (ClpP class)
MQPLADLAWQVITNPNVAFLFLVLGLWSALLAVMVPGTGVAEGAAFVSLALAAVGLFNLPVSLVGLALIGLSMLLFVGEVHFPTHGALLITGSIIMGLGALLLFPASDRSAAHLSWITIIGTPVVTTGFFALLMTFGLAAQKRPAVQDLRQLIGARGVTRTEVSRQGTVYVAGEEWSATAETKIPPDTDVVVLERLGLRLKIATAPSGASSKIPVGHA